MAVSRKLNPSSLRVVREALCTVSSKWEDIGIELRLDKNTLDAIKKEKINIVGDCLTEMISTYLKRVDPEPSWNAIIQALKTKAISETQLAEEIEQTCDQLSSQEQNTESENCEVAVVQRNLNQVIDPDQRECITFPYLDISKLSPPECKDIIQRLSSDYTEILRKFATLQACVCQSLESRKIPVEKIANCALSLAIHKSDDVPRPLKAEEQKSLEDASSMDRIFINLRRHNLMSYFDHGILKHIVDIHGSEDDKCRLKEYIDTFQAFCRRKVYEVPPVISECTSTTRRIFKVLMTSDMSTSLADVAAAERKIADILGVPHSALILHEIKPGSLVLKLSVSASIAEKLFPLQKAQLDQLEANKFSIISRTSEYMYMYVCDTYYRSVKKLHKPIG
jgi:hypothetical protein